MRDDSYLDSATESVRQTSTWRNRTATMAGALISVAILTIIVVWSYRLGVRDADDVPFIRAASGITKERPADGGGLEVAHQGRQVYDALTNKERPSAAPVLAPAPETLTAEDLAPVETATPARRPDAVETPEIEAPSEAAPTDTEIAALSREAEAAAIEQAVEEALNAAPSSKTAPQSSILPAPRPDRLIASIRPAESEAEEPRREALASTIQIQLGAYLSEAEAAARWTGVKNRNGDLLAGRGRVITRTNSGGRALFRLRAGPFADKSEASGLCRALKERGEDCILAVR